MQFTVGRKLDFFSDLLDLCQFATCHPGRVVEPNLVNVDQFFLDAWRIVTENRFRTV